MIEKKVNFDRCKTLNNGHVHLMNEILFLQNGEVLSACEVKGKIIVIEINQQCYVVEFHSNNAPLQGLLLPIKETFDEIV